MKKRVLSLLLCLCMVLGMVPNKVFAVENTTTNIQSNEIKILGTSKSAAEADQGPKQLFDGNCKDTKWCIAHNRGWVVFDLGKPVYIGKMKAYHAGQSGDIWDWQNAENTREYALQSYNGMGKPAQEEYGDDSKWKTIAEEKGNYADIKETYCLMEKTAQYFRLNITNSASPTLENRIRFYELELKILTDPVTFIFKNGNEGCSGTMNPIKMNIGDSYTIPTCKYIRDGYVLDYWQDEEGKKYLPGDNITVASDVTLTANWRKAKQFTVSFDSNKGNGTMDSSIVQEQSIYELPGCSFKRDGYLFEGWQIEGDDLLQPGEKITITSDLKLRAIWKEHFVLLRINTNEYGGGHMNYMNPIYTRWNQSIILPYNEFTPPEGKVFDYWQLEGDITKYHPGDSIRIKQDKTLTAMWKVPEVAPNKIEVSYLDENNHEKTVQATPIREHSSLTGGKDNWYVVDQDAILNGRLYSSDRINLILKDGCTLTVWGGVSSETDIYIYGQQNSSGKLIANATFESGIRTGNSFYVYGGSVEGNNLCDDPMHIPGPPAMGICVGENMVVEDKANVYGKAIKYIGIQVKNMTVSGGSVTAEGGREEGRSVDVIQANSINVEQNGILTVNATSKGATGISLDAMIDGKGTILGNAPFETKVDEELTISDIFIPENQEVTDTIMDEICIGKIHCGKYFVNLNWKKTFTEKGSEIPLKQITKPGIYVVTFTDSKNIYKPIKREFILKGLGNATVSIDNWTYNGTAHGILDVSSKTNPKYSVKYISTDGANYNSEIIPTNSGSYKAIVSFAATEVYEGFEKEVEFCIAKKELEIKAKDQNISYAKIPEIQIGTEHVTVTALGVGDQLHEINLKSNDKYNKVSVSNPIIKNQSGLDVTDNYNITFVDGNLTRVHDWSDPTYKWEMKDGHWTCIASRIDKYNETIVEKSEGLLKSTQNNAPTCTEKGETKYIATFTKDWAKTQTKVVADLEMVSHNYGEWKVVKESTTTEKGVEERVCSVCGKKETKELPLNVQVKPEPMPQQEVKPEPEKPTTPVNQDEKVGTKVVDEKTKGEFKVLKSNEKTKEVQYTAPTSKNVKIVKIPDVVLIKGVSYKVTSVSKDAFKNNKNVKKVTIGKNIKKIDKKAFYGCKNLKTLIIGKNVMTIEDDAFKNCTSLAKVTIPSNVTKIDKNAFSGCKKLKKITIKSKKLKYIGKNAIKNINKKAYIDVPNSKVKIYKKLFKSKTGYKKSMKLK